MQICVRTRLDFGGKSWSRKNKKRFKKRENLETFREHKLSRMGQNRIFCVLNFRENFQNWRKFLLLNYNKKYNIENA